MKIRLIMAGVLLALLSACAEPSLEELQQAAPKGTVFQAELAQQYQRLSEDEERRYDWLSSGLFAEKGLQAAYGHNPEPEELGAWNIPQEYQEDLTAARAKLMQALTDDNKQNAPEALAKTQVFFDCWVENAAESGHADEIIFCRENFAESLKTVSLTPETAGGEPPANVPGEQYMLFFGMDEDQLTDQGWRIIEQIVEELKAMGDGYRVMVNGHTDRVYTEQYNFALSHRRADSVSQALVEMGVPQGMIQAFGFGETDPLEPTEDDVPSATNRRVEIYIGKD